MVESADTLGLQPSILPRTCEFESRREHHSQLLEPSVYRFHSEAQSYFRAGSLSIMDSIHPKSKRGKKPGPEAARLVIPEDDLGDVIDRALETPPQPAKPAKKPPHEKR